MQADYIAREACMPRVLNNTAFRSVQPFLQESRSWPTHTHTERERERERVGESERETTQYQGICSNRLAQGVLSRTPWLAGVI